MDEYDDDDEVEYLDDDDDQYCDTAEYAIGADDDSVNEVGDNDDDDDVNANEDDEDHNENKFSQDDVHEEIMVRQGWVWSRC